MLNLHRFLLENKDEILDLTEQKTLELAGTRPSSDQLKQGLPIFFQQLLGILSLERSTLSTKPKPHGRETATTQAANEAEVAEVAESAALHGIEMLRLGYTLSHVVHAYGAMCQSITELAEIKEVLIDAIGFHELNQCLDVAIAGAVTEYQKLRDTQEKNREDQHLGFFAHEMRNALTSAMISLQLMKSGKVGFSGHTGMVLEKSLKRMQNLIDRSLMDVRLRVDPQVHPETESLLLILDQILVTAEVEAQSKKQKIEFKIDPNLIIEADQQAFHSALSNLIQNALKFTPAGGKILIRGLLLKDKVVIEVEDECGGLSTHAESDLFKAFEQNHENKSGMGLGLTIAQRAITLNHGKIEVQNLPGKGCIFRIILPQSAQHSMPGLSTTPNSSTSQQRKSIN